MKIDVHREQDVVTVSWNNREAPVHGTMTAFLVVFWVFWAPVTVLLTRMALVEETSKFLYVWLVGGWLGTLLVPASLATSLSRERLEIGPDFVRHRYSLLPFMGGRLRTKRLSAFVLGRQNDESVTTLRLRAGWRSRMLGYLSSVRVKAELFNVIAPLLLEVRPDLDVRVGDDDGDGA